MSQMKKFKITINKNNSYVPIELTPATIQELNRSKTRDGTIGEFIMNTDTNKLLKDLKMDTNIQYLQN